MEIFDIKYGNIYYGKSHYKRKITLPLSTKYLCLIIKKIKK
jgi:hypothetical protein